jgi:nickel-dependent lactate racemase
MKVALHYGPGQLSLNIPDANIGAILRPWQNPQQQDNAALIDKALASQHVADFQAETADKHLCVLLDDATRNVPLHDILPPLFETLKNTARVRFIICTGTHNPQTPANIAIADLVKDTAIKTGLTNFEVNIHDCWNDSFQNAGQTSLGTEVIFNTAVSDADAFLVLSDVKFHYFAGYSNPIKNFVPGICAYSTTEQNHSLSLKENSTAGRHPWHPDKNRHDNPLAQDQLEGMQFIVKNKKVYTLITITASDDIQWAQFGPVQEIAARAFTLCDQKNMHKTKRTNRLIVSPGGLPNDVDLYIAQRALELTKPIVNDGGEILFLAQCPKGLGEEHTMENFYNRMTLPLDEILNSIQTEYKLFTHKPYRFAQLIKRLRRIWIHSAISDDLLLAAHLYPAHDPQRIVDQWLKECPTEKITIVDGANKLALYPKDQ